MLVLRLTKTQARRIAVRARRPGPRRAGPAGWRSWARRLNLVEAGGLLRFAGYSWVGRPFGSCGSSNVST
ncbi:MAG: hypothetical protein ACR2JG_14220, partial [Geodermatophilaceae bacterium]